MITVDPVSDAIVIASKLLTPIRNKSLPSRAFSLAGYTAFNFILFPKVNLVFMSMTCYNQDGKKAHDALQDILFSKATKNVDITLTPYRRHGLNGITGNLFGRNFNGDNLKLLWQMNCHRFGFSELQDKDYIVRSLIETEFPTPIKIIEEGWLILHES